MTATQTRRRSRTGRPPLTNRATLLAAAAEIGLPQLTVSAVTTAVGVKYSTFYRHFPSLAALTAALADQAFAELELPDPGIGWRDYLTATASSLTELLARHPGLANAAVGLPELPAGVLTAHRGMTDALLGAGFSPDQAALAASTVLQTAATPWLVSPAGGPTAGNRARQLAATDEPIDPRVREATAALVDDGHVWITRMIDQLVRGLGHAPVPDSG
jgi:AcrR family transcriptional regulator